MPLYGALEAGVLHEIVQVQAHIGEDASVVPEFGQRPCALEAEPFIEAFAHVVRLYDEGLHTHLFPERYLRRDQRCADALAGSHAALSIHLDAVDDAESLRQGETRGAADERERVGVSLLIFLDEQACGHAQAASDNCKFSVVLIQPPPIMRSPS